MSKWQYPGKPTCSQHYILEKHFETMLLCKKSNRKIPFCKVRMLYGVSVCVRHHSIILYEDEDLPTDSFDQFFFLSLLLDSFLCVLCFCNNKTAAVQCTYSKYTTNLHTHTRTRRHNTDTGDCICLLVHVLLILQPTNQTARIFNMLFTWIKLALWVIPKKYIAIFVSPLSSFLFSYFVCVGVLCVCMELLF